MTSHEETRLNADTSTILDVLLRDRAAVRDQWLAELQNGGGNRSAVDLQALGPQIDAVIAALDGGLRAGADTGNLDAAAWNGLRDVLANLSSGRAAQGASAGDTSQVVLALKRPLFSTLQKSLSKDPERLGDMLWKVSSLVDRMAQHTANTHQRAREAIIERQQQELLELSTPVVKLWEGVLAVPMIGTLDSSRTQIVMESLLQKIVETGSGLAIIDITGVPTVDTLVAQHLLKTVTAIRLMGADCIISGIRPQIAQTIVHLGIDLQGITTKASLADALSVALKRSGFVVTRAAATKAAAA
jgi:rsbT co-antagonist protein RsbR